MNETGNRRPQVAPPPPPPPDRDPSRRGSSGRAVPGSSEGFQPTPFGRMLLELAVVLVVVIALGALAYGMAGRLAAWATPWIPLEIDHRLGQLSRKQLQTDQKECSAATAYVRQIAEPLVSALTEKPFPLTFVVQKDPTVNAFALPGGFVTVNSGLLEAATTGEEVAGVLAHEIQHALLRHGTKRILRQLGGSLVLGLLWGGTDLDAVGRVAGRLSSLSYDRDQESEADRRGVELLLRAGVDPRGLAQFFGRLEQQSGTRPPELLSTHPDPGERAKLVRQAASGRSFGELPPPPSNPCRSGDW